MRCIELKICLVSHQNPASNFGTTYFFFFTNRGIKCQMQFWNILGKPHLAFSNLNVYEVYY
jgi:hypothetical protein